MGHGIPRTLEEKGVRTKHCGESAGALGCAAVAAPYEQKTASSDGQAQNQFRDGARLRHRSFACRIIRRRGAIGDAAGVCEKARKKNQPETGNQRPCIPQVDIFHSRRTPVSNVPSAITSCQRADCEMVWIFRILIGLVRYLSTPLVRALWPFGILPLVVESCHFRDLRRAIGAIPARDLLRSRRKSEQDEGKSPASTF